MSSSCKRRSGLASDKRSYRGYSPRTTVYTPRLQFTVFYDGNGNTGGAVPVDEASPYYEGYPATVLSNSGSLVKPYQTFVNWNTAADGSGVSYDPLDKFAVTTDTVLYAQWSPMPEYSLTYEGNSSTGGDPPAPAYHTMDSVVTVLSSGTLTKTGYYFGSWNTSALGSGTDYNPGDTFIITADTTLYAIWVPLPIYYLAYDPAYATGGSAPGQVDYFAGDTVIVSENIGSLTRTGYVWVCWNNLLNGSGDDYIPGTTFNIYTDTVLYAKWVPE